MLFLVTGGAGFIGSNLCEYLINMGYHVRCLDNLSTGDINNMKNLINNPRFTFLEYDIRDLEMCLSATKDVDYVLHQAAWGSVPRSIELPLFYEDNNIKGTLNMLEASRVNNIKKFVFASSSSVYGDSTILPKTESSIGNVLSPYALTKKTNEEYAKLYTDLYGLKTYGLRYFNVFGRKQDPNGQYAAVIPKFINMISNGIQPTINGDGTHSRDFTYINNVIQANINACLETDIDHGIFNIAYGGRITLNDVFNNICELLGSDLKPIHGDGRIGDITHSYADITNAKINLKYDPVWSFEDGLSDYIEYLKNENK